MRRALLTTALTALVLTACGDAPSDSETAAGPDATGVLAPSATAEAALSAAEAEALAKASLLTSADLPGYTSTPALTSEDPEEEAAEAELEECVGVQSPDYLAEESSPDFSKGELPAAVEVSSEVSVVKTADEGKADLEAFLSDKALACFESFFDKALQAEVGADSGITFGEATVTRRSISRPDAADESFALRLSTSVEAGGQSFPVVVDIAGALVGRAELSLLSSSFGGSPLPDAEQARLLGVMAERADKAQS